jgi:DNA repair exonuclease SbcCD ATPase subunit
VGRQLQQRQQQLDDELEQLQQQAARVDAAALRRDLAALQALADAHASLARLQRQHDAASAALEGALGRRYASLLSVLQSLNAALGAVYGQLTGGCGAAYCSYVAERRLLFSQGVTLHVQPDGSTWRRMEQLSGGQRALATLALSFALQVRLCVPGCVHARGREL